ncbi:hypothetical protein RB653_008815 [Dictyostelium firmibasis]|uniref:Peptide chain release factor domain-containing protein n=1 Tax=Dictyostelium firmibasis TaxID=79012 RepID=A0AAN7YRZ1_9MYCE
MFFSRLKNTKNLIRNQHILFNNNNNNRNKKYFCTTIKTNDDSIQEVIYKEKEVKRIIELLFSSQYHKNNLSKMQKFEDMKLADMIENGIDSSNADTIERIKSYNQTKQSIGEMNSLSKEYKDYLEMVEMSKTLGDSDWLKETHSLINQLFSNCRELETNALMNGKEDGKGCFIEIQAGAGGNDSMDWTKILFEMYYKWGVRKGFNVKVVDTTPGDFGYRRASLKIDSDNAFGWMRTEMGIHKLIRISPFSVNGKRHTSFASVVVYPIADDSINIDLHPRDLHFETLKGSGPGGQHVNTTESAVRIVHIPTGISVLSCGERSQHQNKSTGLSLLKSKLYTHELKKRMETEKSFRDELGKNGWASDSIVRTYTMHPQERVKDQRTGSEVLQISKILDGEEELDIMIKKALSD